MATKKSGRKQTVSLQQRMAKHGWVFVSPFVVGLVLIYIEIIANSVIFSFSTLETGVDGYTLRMAGWANYHYTLFENASFVRTVISSVGSMLAQIPIIIIFSLFIATLLNQKMKLKGFFRAVFFIPAVLITGAVAASSNGNALLDSLQSGAGIVTEAGAQSVAGGTFLQDMLTSIAMSESMSEYIINAVDNIFSIVNMCGVQILIFLSALQSVSPSIYESAKMEGANGWDCYWKITFPMISPMVYVCVIFTIIDSFVNSGNSIMTMVYNLGIKQNKAGIASSMSWLYSLVVLAFLGVATLIMRRFVFYQEKD